MRRPFFLSLRRQPSQVFFRTRHNDDAEDAATNFRLLDTPTRLLNTPNLLQEYESQDVSLFLEEEEGDFEGKGGAIVVWRCAGGRGGDSDGKI